MSVRGSTERSTTTRRSQPAIRRGLCQHTFVYLWNARLQSCVSTSTTRSDQRKQTIDPYSLSPDDPSRAVFTGISLPNEEPASCVLVENPIFFVSPTCSRTVHGWELSMNAETSSLALVSANYYQPLFSLFRTVCELEIEERDLVRHPSPSRLFSADEAIALRPDKSISCQGLAEWFLFRINMDFRTSDD